MRWLGGGCNHKCLLWHESVGTRCGATTTTISESPQLLLHTLQGKLEQLYNKLSYENYVTTLLENALTSKAARKQAAAPGSLSHVRRMLPILFILYRMYKPFIRMKQ